MSVLLLAVLAVVSACAASPRARVEAMLAALQQGKPTDTYWADGAPPSDLRGELSAYTLTTQAPRPEYERERLTVLLKMKRDTLDTVEMGLRAHNPVWLTDTDADWLRFAVHENETALQHVVEAQGTAYTYALRRPLKEEETWTFVTNPAGQIVRADNRTLGHIDAAASRCLQLVTRMATESR